ncbi:MULTISPECIES: cbb3-type cytochrome oxidase assembly protein CcoS [unclassified Rhizobium]|uniref:cbb3-type cytochrome oxidase assembly protein CcoS n=1 Tax=unclassified Rhizobium TaxID=2613769 RepID=UPI00135679D2|nr:MULTISPECIES: cbb3-type cytochrome oxidase assembly protein CcoS [unclassified Rhizobium]
MTALEVLVPLSVAMGVVGLAAFLWSMRNRQYEDLDGAAERILLDDNDEPG